MQPYFDGMITFVVVDSRGFDNDISEKIGFEPTKIIVKGQNVTSKCVAPYNIWQYHIEFDDNSFNSSLTSFSKHLLQFKDNIDDIVSKYERVGVNFYINTQYGQFGFILSSKELVELSKLGLEVDFHFLSFGEVKE